jgi:hypothetical protein
MKPALEHRHYKLIAGIIADLDVVTGGVLNEQIKASVAEHFAKELRRTNPRFSHSRFVSAAMGEPCNGRDKVR